MRSVDQRSVVESTVTKSTNRIKELIADKGSVSKLCKFAKSIEEARDKARYLTGRLEDLAPESIETDGMWLEDLEYDVNEVLGEVSDYLAETRKTETQILEADSSNVNKAENSSVLSGEFQFNKGSGLKGVKVPTFEGNPDKWPYLWGIFISLVHQNRALSGLIKLTHLNNSFSDKVRSIIACLTEVPGDYEKAVKLLTERYWDPR